MSAIPVSERDVEELKRITRVRLARVCEGWSVADTEDLLDHIVRIELKYRPDGFVRPKY